MRLQNYVNMISALIVFIAGIVIIVMFPGRLSSQYRILIGLFVTLYFFLRMGQTILAIKRERRKSLNEINGIAETGNDNPQRPKSP